jgi:hypothetical protein
MNLVLRDLVSTLVVRRGISPRAWSTILAGLALGVLTGCDVSSETGTTTCRANLGAVEILDVWSEDQTLHIAGQVMHHCQTPSVVALRFNFLDIDGTVLAVRDAAATGPMAVPGGQPKEFEWNTPMINGVDSISARVVGLTAE